MSASAEWAISRSVRISRSLTAEMTVGPGGFVCEWLPDRPRRLSAKQCRRYRAGRDALLAELAERTGQRIMVVELSS